MPLTVKQALSLAERLRAAGHDVDQVRRFNGKDWQVAVLKPDNNFELYDENVRVTKPEP